MPATLFAYDVMESMPEGYHPVRLDTDMGVIETRHYPVPGARAAVIWMGGSAGGYDSPAHGLYPRLAKRLQPEGIAGLRVSYRNPTQLRDSVADVLAAMEFLRLTGIDKVGLVGHSLGGAVAAQAAGLTPEARALVVLAPQSHGAAAVAHLGNRCPVLVIHGAEDEILPPACGHNVFDLARHPKRLELIHGAGHCLDEAADQVETLVHDWLVENLIVQ